MAIEIRQLIIKTDIVQQAEGAPLDAGQQQRLKHELLNACRQMVLALLRERGER